LKGYVCIRWEGCSEERGYVEGGEELRWWIRKMRLYRFYYECVRWLGMGYEAVQVQFYMLIYDYCNVARGDSG
jgi:hypothetical protein